MYDSESADIPEHCRHIRAEGVCNGGVAEICCAIKVVSLRKAVVECDLTSSRKKGAHLFVEKCAPFGKEERT